MIVKKVLEKDTFPISFNERDFNIITNELLYYFLNICDKTLHNTYGHEIKTKIMDSLIDLNAKNLDEVKEDIILNFARTHKTRIQSRRQNIVPAFLKFTDEAGTILDFPY